MLYFFSDEIRKKIEAIDRMNQRNADNSQQLAGPSSSNTVQFYQPLISPYGVSSQYLIQPGMYVLPSIRPITSQYASNLFVPVPTIAPPHQLAVGYPHVSPSPQLAVGYPPVSRQPMRMFDLLWHTDSKDSYSRKVWVCLDYRISFLIAFFSGTHLICQRL